MTAVLLVVLVLRLAYVALQASTDPWYAHAMSELPVDVYPPWLFYASQQALSVATAGILGAVSTRISGKVAGVATAAIFLAYGPTLFFASRQVPETVALAALAGVLYLQDGRLAGVGAFLRPELILLAPLCRRHVAAGLALGLVAAAVAGNAGVTLYHGNAPGAYSGMYSAPPALQVGRQDQEAVATAEASRRAGRELTPGQADRFWLLEAIRARAADPLGTVYLVATRAALVVSNLEVALETAPRQDANPLRWIAPLPFAAILGLAAAGVMLRGWAGTGGWPIWGAAIALTVPLLVFFVASRYRLPLAAVLCIPAGIGVESLWYAPERRTRWTT